MKHFFHQSLIISWNFMCFCFSESATTLPSWEVVRLSICNSSTSFFYLNENELVLDIFWKCWYDKLRNNKMLWSVYQVCAMYEDLRTATSEPSNMIKFKLTFLLHTFVHFITILMGFHSKRFTFLSYEKFPKRFDDSFFNFVDSN